MYKILKEKNYKYLVKIYWILSEIKYKDTKFIYKQHLATKQQIGALVMELGKFLIEKYLNGRKWQNCTLSTCLQHIKNKNKNIKHQLKKDYSLRLLNGIKSKIYSS